MPNDPKIPDLEARLKSVDYLYRAVASLVTARSKAELFDLAFRNISEFIPFDALAILYLYNSNAQIIIKPQNSISKLYISDIENNVKQSLASLIGGAGESIVFRTEIKEFEEGGLPQKPGSQIVLPLLSGLKIVGMLHLSSSSTGVFNDEEDVKILCILATQLAVIVERISSYENLIAERLELRQKNFELAALNEISKSIGYSLNILSLSKTIIQLLASVIKFDAASALAVEEGVAHLVILKTAPLSPSILTEVKEHIVSCFDSLSRTPINNDKLVVDIEKSQGMENTINELKSFFDIPIRWGEKILGIISISSVRESAFCPDDLMLLKTISGEISAAVQSLYDMIFTEKSKLKSIFNSMDEGLILLDEKGRIALLNQAARKIFEIKAGNEPTTLRFLSKFRPEISGFSFQFMRWVNEALLNQVVTKDIMLQKPYPMILHLILGPVLDDKGRIMGVLALLRDITEEKQKEQLRAGFLSAVSHELRTPLGVIKEGVEMVLEGVGGRLNPKQKKYLEMVYCSINGLKIVINQLLSMADLESQSIKIKKSRQNIVKVIHKTLEIMNMKIKEKRIKMILKMPSRPVFLRIDFYKIQQVLLSLLDNAVKFTKKGGRIEIILNKNTISVRDFGRGIREKDQEKLFQPFSELNTFLDRGERGIGLGLAIAKAYVEAHGGYISLTSKVGHGSIFSFSLPLKKKGAKHA